MSLLKSEQTAGLVSVILPNRNHGHYLRSSIPRLLAQTYADLEIIVVDDASTDDSCSIVEAFAAEDPRVRLLRLDDHAGIAGAVSRGMPLARGGYIYCAAADDAVFPTFFERSLAAFGNDNSAAFCFSDPTERHEDGTYKNFPLYLSSEATVFSPDAIEAMLRSSYFHFSSNTIIYRRQQFLDIGGFRSDLHWLCDWFVVNALALRYGACYVPESLTSFQIQQVSYSAVSLRRTKKQRELYYRVLDLLHAPEFADILPRFRRAALLPEYRLRNLKWLASDGKYRDFVSARLVWRIVGRGTFHYLRNLMPNTLRRRLRRMASSVSAWSAFDRG